MQQDHLHSKLDAIRVDLISRNEDNPRIIFRPGELEELQESIRLYGVQVPITVYREGKRFVLIDGERRWRCCMKLNKETIPAIIQQKPSNLDNLLLMFNIHALREQWDLVTIALKLPKVIELIKKNEGSEPSERTLSERTGLNRSIIRRCKLLLDLPQKYIKEILEELNKPKSQQRITEDLFIELERALKTVENNHPDLLKHKDDVRQSLINKYKSGVIVSKVQLRKVAKIARSENVGVTKATAHKQLEKLFTEKNYSIDSAYNNSVASAYADRDVASTVQTLIMRLEAMRPNDLDDATRDSLKRLRLLIDTLLRS